MDFAGEKIEVTKTIEVGSKEEKELQKATPKKKTGNLEDILASIGNKPKKMSTLEKSKMDWDNFKGKEGITDDLKI